MRRSMLFIPGNTPNLLMNGDVLGADSIILDLEDAVSPAEKDSARILVRNALKSLHYKGCEIIIRINPVETDYWMKDLDEIIPLKPNMIMPPKVSGAQDVKTVSEYIAKLEEKCGFEKNTVKLIPLIETAMGVENAFQIASADERVAAMFLGGEDLTADLRCKRTKGQRNLLCPHPSGMRCPRLRHRRIRHPIHRRGRHRRTVYRRQLCKEPGLLRQSIHLSKTRRRHQRGLQPNTGRDRLCA